MGLSVDDFVNASSNFEQVSFLKSVDGALVIDEFGPKTSMGKADLIMPENSASGITICRKMRILRSFYVKN